MNAKETGPTLGANLGARSCGSGSPDESVTSDTDRIGRRNTKQALLSVCGGVDERTSTSLGAPLNRRGPATRAVHAWKPFNQGWP